jgi:hypothetical protein
MASITNAGTVPTGSTAQWQDKKRYLWLIGLVVPSLAFVAVGLHALTGWSVWFCPVRRISHRLLARRPR